MPSDNLEPKNAFKDKIRQLVPGWHISTNFGASNSFLAQTDKDRIYFAGPNLANFHTNSASGLAIAGVVRFATGTDVYIAMYIQSAVQQVKDRLQKMLQLANSGDTNYSARNNNVRFVFSQTDQNFYMFNKENWIDIDFSETHVQPSITVDKLVYAVYPPGKPSFQNLATGEFIRFLRKNLGTNKVEEISVWEEDENIITPSMQRKPVDVSLKEIEDSIREQNLHYTDDLVARLHVALNHLPYKHFVILTGLSGTGKTSLIRSYAHAVHGINDLFVNDPLFFMCPVRPEWTDPTGLTGYYDVIAGQYVIPAFLEAVFTASAHPNSPIFVCLDEMNLARVEYYFSDILSAIETREPVHLHSNAAHVDGSTGSAVPSSIQLPENLYIAGTINIDETTNPISDKVLDRAIVIDVSTVDLQGAYELWKEEEADIETSINACAPVLNTVHQILLPHKLEFGYRVAKEFILYHHFAVRKTGRDSKSTIDEQLIQKIFVKLRGDSRQRQMLLDLIEYLDSQKFTASVNLLESMVNELDQLGAFQYAR